MLRVIFDTNIYGFLIEEPDFAELQEQIIEDKEFVVYNYKPIRQEIRDIQKVTKLSKQTRNIILNLYDQITGNHFLENSLTITKLAKQYHDCYKNNGGIYGWDTNIKVDFMIVACASFEGLDVVYSGDIKTLLNKNAIKAYHHINLKENFRTPNFLKYSDLLKKFRKTL
jgi:hypothetical protein|tara:strand:- start:543 stop:1049 length:507 start_codon:yes stop_codon:yes gene_type:complete